jgi:hypothetical protein
MFICSAHNAILPGLFKAIKQIETNHKLAKDIYSYGLPKGF